MEYAEGGTLSEEIERHQKSNVKFEDEQIL